MKISVTNFKIGKQIDLLSIESVTGFSPHSRLDYLESDEDENVELTINLSLLDSPNGIYTLTVTPDIVSGTIDGYNLMVGTEYNRRKNDINFNSLNGKKMEMIQYHNLHISRNDSVIIKL